MELYAVGKIVGCFGVKGFVKIQPSSHSLDRFLKLKDVFFGISPAAAGSVAVVEEVMLKPPMVMLKFREIDDRNKADQLVGQTVFVEFDSVEQPDPGSYFVHDILGCNVVSTEGNPLGVVEDVLKYPGQDIWVVRRDGREHLVPAVKEFIHAVDTTKRTIVVKLIEGLIEE